MHYEWEEYITSSNSRAIYLKLTVLGCENGYGQKERYSRRIAASNFNMRCPSQFLIPLLTLESFSKIPFPINAHESIFYTSFCRVLDCTIHRIHFFVMQQTSLGQ